LFLAGLISLEEFSNGERAVITAQGGQWSPEETLQLFQGLDTNGDGFIDLDGEFDISLAVDPTFTNSASRIHPSFPRPGLGSSFTNSA
jgi:hypothetical protein